MPGHFGSLIPGSRPQQSSGEIGHARRQCADGAGGVARIKVKQACGAGLVLHQRPDSAAMIRAHDQIAFPMSSLATILGVEGMLMGTTVVTARA